MYIESMLQVCHLLPNNQIRKCLPFWMLLIAFAFGHDWVCTKLHQTFEQFQSGPIELWVRAVTKAKQGKLDIAEVV
jgi:hypothetical protein